MNEIYCSTKWEQDEKKNCRAINDIKDLAQKCRLLIQKWKETQANLLEGRESIINDIIENSHAWYYANVFGGYILLCDSNNDCDAIEDFGDAFLALDYKGLIHDPEEIPEKEREDYYPYNGGELYIDMPVILEQIY